MAVLACFHGTEHGNIFCCSEKGCMCLLLSAKLPAEPQANRAKDSRAEMLLSEFRIVCVRHVLISLTAAQQSDSLSRFAGTLATLLGHRAKCPFGCPLLTGAVLVLSLGSDCKL